MNLTISEISAEALEAKMKLSKPVLLDVREIEELEDELGALPDIINVPLGTLQDVLSELDGFKDKEIITVCRSGMRASSAAEILLENGFKNVSVLSGGMIAWRENFSE